MTYPHRIRLRTPWELHPIRCADPDRTVPPGRDVVMPASLRQQGLPDFAGTVLLRRRFGYPGRIDSWERVWLILEQIEGQAEIRVNGETLGSDRTGFFEHDVTTLLQLHNVLEVVLASPSDTGGLLGEIALEVRAQAYLERMKARRRPDGGIHAEGMLRGACEDPLEIYAILDRHSVAYQTIECLPQGRAFVIDIPPEEAKGERLRIELVNRSQIWYAIELIPDPFEFS